MTEQSVVVDNNGNISGNGRSGHHDFHYQQEKGNILLNQKADKNKNDSDTHHTNLVS